MPRNTNEMNAEQLIEHLSSHDPVGECSYAESIIQKQNPTGLKSLWNIIIMIAITCCIFLLNFMYFVPEYDSNSLIIGAMVSIGIAFILQPSLNNDKSIQHDFVKILSYAFMITGKILFVSGLYKVFHHFWGINLALCIVCAMTYYHFRIPSERFLSTFITLIFIQSNMLDAGANEWLWNGFFILQFICALTLQLYGKATQGITPFFYALLFSLILMAGYFSTTFTPIISVNDLNHTLHNPLYINILMCMTMLVLYCWSDITFPKQKQWLFSLAYIVNLFLGILISPIILLLMTITMLGFIKYNNKLIQLSLIFITYFIIYLLSFTLNQLQLVLCLIGSGLILITASNHFSLPNTMDHHSENKPDLKQVVMIASLMFILVVFNYGLYYQSPTNTMIQKINIIKLFHD